MKKIILLSVVLLCFMVSCAPTEVSPKDSLLTKIQQFEDSIGDDVTMDTTVAFKLGYAYIRYYEDYKEDSIAPYYLSKAADIFKEIPEKRLKAVNLYNKLLVEKPNHTITPRAVFMIGFVFDEKYDDVERAKKSYTYFIENYPNHPLVPDAKNLLELLSDTTQSDLEQVQSWMNK